MKLSNGKIYWAFMFIQHSYPSPDDYQFGVKTELLIAERENPNAKVIQNSIMQQANNQILQQNLYEVLLVNAAGEITEGSKSNVFFLKDHVFYTAPASTVLVGITRQKVIECVMSLNYNIKEIAVPVSEISKFDAVFITGTSPKILPVSSIGNFNYQTQLPELIRLMDKYDHLINLYLDSN